MRKKRTELRFNPGRDCAVLTGDVVGSSKLEESARRALPKALKKASQAARAVYGRAVPLEIDVFRGDSWQLLVTDAAVALRIAVFFRAYLRGCSPGIGLDTRIAIGIGAISFLSGKRVSEGDGAAFRESGMLLESMPRSRRLVLAVAEGRTPAEIAPLVSLIDTVMERWTEKQALAVIGALQGLKQGEIGKSWKPPVRQSVIARHLRLAGWEAIGDGLIYVENSLNKLYIIK